MFRTDAEIIGADREGERGASMVTVLLVSLLLLIASAGVLLESSVNTANVTDAVADLQAYNAAESGIQSALHVLRGYAPPSPLLDPNQSASNPANQITYYRAVVTGSSNYSGDPSTSARLSRWVNYNYTPTGSTVPDRVVLSGEPYTPQTGTAYSLQVYDPDSTGTNVSFSTSASIDSGTNVKTWGSGGDTATIRFNAVTGSVVNASTGAGSSSLGNWVISATGAGATIPKTAFTITINMLLPFQSTRVIRGYFETGNVTPTSAGALKIRYETQTVTIMGSSFTLTGGIFYSPTSQNDIGYVVLPNAPNVSGGITAANVSVTPAEPQRLLIRATGFGPRGAKKMLETVIQRNYFGGNASPATIALVGPSNGFVFNPGNASSMTYSGDDQASNYVAPPIGVSNDANLQTVRTALSAFNGTVIGTPANVTTELPTWLQSTSNLDTVVRALRATARASGGYYTSGQVPSKFGEFYGAKGITFIEGDVELTGSGGGIIVCSGTLTLKGNVNFNGMIIVTGAGGLLRSGQGNGVIQGNIVVAPYDINNLAAGFSAPKYDLSGGGNSVVTYNSSLVYNGMDAVSDFVLGVGER